MPEMSLLDLYDELHEKRIGRSGRLERAKEFVADPSRLSAAFAATVDELARYAPNDEPFYASRNRYDSKPRSSTAGIALLLRDVGTLRPEPRDRPALLEEEQLHAPGVVPVDAGDLGVEYLDREIVATRKTAGEKYAGRALRLDLLLRNCSDHIPVVAEIKRTSDETPTATDMDALSALIQGLACIAQLASPSQFSRLTRWGRSAALNGRDVPGPVELARVAPPVFDLYVMLHNEPLSTHLPELTVEAERLSALLLAEPQVARHVRRIACLITRIEGDAIVATTRFAYQRATPASEAIETAFADYFDAWGLFLPDAAVASRSAGNLQGCGWMVRWRWHDDGSLEFRAYHRMTNERWHLISPTGETTWINVPSEFMFHSPGEDETRVRAEYQAAWREHGESIARRGMEFEAEDLRDNEKLGGLFMMAWKLDDGQWTSSALPFRREDSDGEPSD